MVAKETDLPDIGEAVGPVLAQVAREHQPLFVALAERTAARRYREWAEEPTLAAQRDELLACADREEDIAARIEGLNADAASIQRDLMSSIPGLEDLNRGIFENRTLPEQLTIQARGERLGAATWRAFAGEASDDSVRETFLACARLEEDSAVVLEAIVGAAVLE